MSQNKKVTQVPVRADVLNVCSLVLTFSIIYDI